MIDRAHDVPGPYVLVGHSFGGMVARHYTTTYPRRIAGLVSIDAQNEDFVAAYKQLLTPELHFRRGLFPSIGDTAFFSENLVAMTATESPESPWRTMDPPRTMPSRARRNM